MKDDSNNADLATQPTGTLRAAQGDGQSGVNVQPSGVYTGEKWFRAAAFGSTLRSIIKTFDPRVYPHNEQITVALVDPASEVDIEIAEANARLIAAAPALYEVVRRFVEIHETMQDAAAHEWEEEKLIDLARAALAAVDKEK